MTRTSRSFLVLIACTASALPGCALRTQTATRTVPAPAETPAVVEAPAQAPASMQADAVRFSGDAVAVDPNGRSPVGLFGERVAASLAAGTQYDGGINISPVSAATQGACFDPDVDPDGARIAFASTMHRPASDIYIKSSVGRTLTQLTNDPADDVMPRFSPDGGRIAFASNRAGNWDVFITSLDGGVPVQVTESTDHEVSPTWSPDGSMLAFSRFGTQSGRWEIWVVELDRPGVSRFLEYGMFPRWSPDVARSKILFQRARERGSQLHSVWTIDYVNGEAMQPTEIVSAANAALISPSWSPDGQRIVFSSVVDPEPGTLPALAEVWVVNLDGTGRRNLLGGSFVNTQPVWAADGNVYFVSNRGGIDNIWAASVGDGFDPIPGGDSFATVPFTGSGAGPNAE